MQEGGDKIGHPVWVEEIQALVTPSIMGRLTAGER